MHNNVKSLMGSHIMNNCFGTGGNENIDSPLSKPPGFMEMLGGQGGLANVVNAFASSMNEIASRTMRLSGTVDKAAVSIDIKDEFTAKLAISVINQMIKKFKEEPPEPSSTVENNSC